MTNDYQVERALLGAVLSGYPHVDELAQVVRPVDFAEPRDERIWGAILSVADSGGKVDPITVRMAMGPEANKLPEGPLYLVKLAEECPTPTSARTYAQQVRENAGRRHLANVASFIQSLPDSGLDYDVAYDHAVSRLAELEDSRAVGDLVWARDVFPKVVDIAEHGRARGLSTPWPGLDRLTSGIQAGRLYVVAARPGVGKSLMGANLALHFGTRHNRASLICTMEMDAVEMMQRITSAHASINLSGLLKGGDDMSQIAWNAIAREHQNVMDLPIVIEDGSNQTVTSIRAKLRRLKRQRDDVALVVVDYLQLMGTNAAKSNRAEALGEVSRGLKIIAREFNVAVVAMAQLNREAAGSRPTVAQIRESGAIEADADVVILLSRPDDELPGIEAIVDKNRSGPRGTTELMVRGHYSRIDDEWRPAS